MATRLLPSRVFLIALIAALLVVAMPVSPVVAQDIAPETVSEVVEDLDVDGSASDDATVVSEVRETEIPFNSIGVKATGDPAVVFRTRSVDGEWQPWQDVQPLDEEDGPDGGTDEAVEAESLLPAEGWVSDAIWVGDSDHIQLRIENGDLDDIEVHTIDSMGLSETLWQRVSRTVQSLTAPAPAEASTYPGLVTRSQWGAKESIRRGSPSYAPVRFAVVHHTAGSNSYSRAEAPGVVRGIYQWHVTGNGWNDIGYNLLVDRYGTVYEGRYGGLDRGVIGAHASGFNTGSFGISVMGNFEVAQVPAAAFSAVRDAMAWQYDIHGIDSSPSRRITVNGRTIPVMVGHRDVGSTTCPGRYFAQRMGELRSGVQSKTGRYPIAVAAAQWPTSDTAHSLDWQAIVGDWNGDGRTTIGRYKDGEWRLWGHGVNGRGFHSFSYGGRGDVPVVGDWNGDGRDGIGIVRNGRWHLRNSLSGGSAQLPVFTYGRVRDGDVPVIGDWNGDGRDGIGIVRNGRWHLRNALSGGSPDRTFTFGRVRDGDVPVVGDWNRSGQSGPGVDRFGVWYLRNTPSGGAADFSFSWR